MHSFLIWGGSQEKRNEWIINKLKEWKVGKFDVSELAPQDSSIGIAPVRDFQKKLYLKPNGSPYSIGVIRQAETLTVEAQNALLKTLEEPPPHARVILESSTADVFLPTILSRCQIINLKNQEQCTQEDLLSCFKTIEHIRAAPIGKRLKLLDTIAKNKEEAATWLDLTLAATRHILLTPYTLHPTPYNQLLNYPVIKLLRSLLKARQHLSANVNYKLALDTVFL